MYLLPNKLRLRSKIAFRGKSNTVLMENRNKTTID